MLLSATNERRTWLNISEQEEQWFIRVGKMDVACFRRVTDAIEQYIGKPIRELDIEKNEYRQTLDFSMETPNDNWRLLLEEQEKSMEKIRKRKKK